MSEPSTLDEALRQMTALRGANDYRSARQMGEAYARRNNPRDQELERLDVAMALATYLDPEHPVRRGLATALALVERHTSTSTDPETLGVAGAIQKRFYYLDLRSEHLERAYRFYGRGHELDRESGWRSQGFPGINAAFVLDQLAHLSRTEALRPEDATNRSREAEKLRREIAHALSAREDTSYFHHVTLGEAHLGLGDFAAAAKALACARLASPKGWERATSARQLARLLRLRSPSGDIPADGRAALGALLGESAEAVCGAIRGKLGLALSGGGFRAALFHLGVLTHLAEVDLLRHVEVLSCVSGGSIVGALYYLELYSLLTTKDDGTITRDDFVVLVARVVASFTGAIQQNMRLRLLRDPAENVAMLLGKRSRTERLGDLIEEHLYKDALSRADLPVKVKMSDVSIVPHGASSDTFRAAHENWSRRAKVPLLVLNAASLNTGHAWQFTPTWMGEPPARTDEDVDVNDRFERRPYGDFPKGPEGALSPQDFRLAHAVAASAAVPAIFEPLTLSGLYGGHTVRLVDGGVHDNQGAAALLEQDCTSLIVSDASGQLSISTRASGDAVGVALRASSVTQARVRESQYLDLRSRQRGRLLETVAFIHLKQGLSPRSLAPNASATETDGALSAHGVSRAVQERLAALRTDLDAFSELEAELLMVDGYVIAEHEIRPEAFDAPLAIASTGQSPAFLRARPLLEAQPAGSHSDRRVLELLDIGASVVGKAFRVSPALRTVGKIIGAVVAVALVVAVVCFWNTQLPAVTVGAIATLLVVGVAKRRLPWAEPWIDAIEAKKALLEKIRIVFVGCAAAVAARIAMRVGDRAFLSQGRIRPLLPPQLPGHQSGEGFPAPLEGANEETPRLVERTSQPTAQPDQEGDLEP